MIDERDTPARGDSDPHFNGRVKFDGFDRRRRAPSTVFTAALVVVGLVVWGFAIYGVVRLAKGNKP